MGLGLGFASSSLSSKLTPGRAALTHTSSPPGPDLGARTLDSSFGSLLVPTWPGPRPQRARPAAACTSPWVSASDGCAGRSLPPEPAPTPKLELRAEASESSHRTRTPETPRKGVYPRAGELLQAPSLPCPAQARWVSARLPRPEPRRRLPRSSRLSAGPSPLPRKAEGFPSGPGTPWHRWCSWLCRACLGAQAGRLRAAATGLGLAGSASSTGAALALTRRPSHARLGAPRPGRPPSVLGAVVSALPASPPQCWSPRPSCGLEAAASRTPRQRGRQRRGGGSGGGRTARRRQGGSPPASPVQRPALRASPSRVCGGGQSRRAGGRGVRGWGRARAGASQTHLSRPPRRPGAALPCAPPQGRDNLERGGQRNRIGGSRNLRPFRFSGPSTHAHGYFCVPTGFPGRHLSQNLSFIPESYRFFIIGS